LKLEPVENSALQIVRSYQWNTVFCA